MSKNILVQLDTDAQTSVFDSVVAVDSGVDHLFRHHDVSLDNVVGLVHGCIFTRGPKELQHTAIFVGGSDVQLGEQLLKKIKKSFLGPLSVSVMMDSNGSNTTAAAAVLVASKIHALNGSTAVVLGATGPVGQRAARLLAGQGAKEVRVASRTLERAQGVSRSLKEHFPDAHITGHATSTPEEYEKILDGAEILIAAGAAGVQFLSADQWQGSSSLKVAIDLNAVPPLGLEGIEVMDKDREINGIHCYGAIGVGGTKMKIHHAAVAQLFESNNQVLDAEEIYELGESILK